jgi:hypothetical protein
MSGCTCLYDYGGFDDCDVDGFQSAEMRTARTPKVCVECRQPIQRGDRYERFSSKQDGEFFSKVTCAACTDIRAALYCGGFYFGQLWSDIHTQIFARHGLTIECIDKLETTVGKEKLQSAWRQYLGVQP